jgi:hypothetical protein
MRVKREPGTFPGSLALEYLRGGWLQSVEVHLVQQFAQLAFFY